MPLARSFRTRAVNMPSTPENEISNFQIDETRAVKATRLLALVSVVVGRVVYQDSAEELSLLVKSDGLEPIGLLEAKRDKPDPAFFIGSGKVDELADLAR